MISKKKVIAPQTRYFLRLARCSPKQKKDHRTANTLCKSLTRKMVIVLCQTRLPPKKIIAPQTRFASPKKHDHCAMSHASPQKNTILSISKWKMLELNTVSFALVKNLCKNAGKYITIFCGYREHCLSQKLPTFKITPHYHC